MKDESIYLFAIFWSQDGHNNEDVGVIATSLKEAMQYIVDVYGTTEEHGSLNEYDHVTGFDLTQVIKKL